MSSLSIESLPGAMHVRFCSQCGQEIAVGAAFCAGCGTSVAGLNTLPRTLLISPDPVPQPDLAPAASGLPQAMRLREGWIRYGAALFLMWFFAIGTFLVSAQASGSANTFAAMVFVWPIIGIYMSRSVMRRLVEWHPTYNTLQNAFSTKMRMVFFWPWDMLVLLFKLSINRVL